MAVEKTIKLNIDARQGIGELKKVRSETDVAYAQLRRTIPVDIDGTKAKTELKNVGDKATELADDVKKVGDNAAESESGFIKMKSGVSAVGLAMKALGIGLIISAFMTLKNALMQNQVVMDKVSVVTEAIGFAFQKVITFAVELGTKMTKAFTDPKQAIADLWTALKQNIVDRIQGLIDTFGALGKVIKGVFSKDLDLMKEGLADAKTGMIQLATGMTEVEQTEFAETIKNASKELKKGTAEAIAYGKAITALKNEVKLAEAQQRTLQLVYQRDAELQRQLRDDISLTFEERIEANRKLGEILDSQFAEEQALTQKKIDLAELELSKNKENINLQVALQDAKTEMAELVERITGQRSEQLVNLTALEKEQQDAIDAQLEAERKLAEDELNAWLKKEAARNKDLADQKIAADKAIEIAKAKAIAEAEIERQLGETRRSIVANSLGQVSALMGEESKAGKALAVGQALINTYSAAVAALAPPPVGAGPIFGPIAAIGAVAAGMMNVKNILSTKLPDVTDSGDDGPPPAIPQALGMGALTPNLEAIEQPTLGGSQPVQAFVIENDISNAQALQEELDIQATL